MILTHKNYYFKTLLNSENLASLKYLVKRFQSNSEI